MSPEAMGCPTSIGRTRTDVLAHYRTFARHCKSVGKADCHVRFPKYPAVLLLD